MSNRTIAAVFAAACLIGAARTAEPAGDPTLLRLFLKDGASLVSYGEPARVGDRVVFSMPTAASPNPPLHLVTIAADRVDWDRTDRYAAAARSEHYIRTQAESDWALLSNDIAQALNDVTLTADPAKRLSIAESARKTLSEWPLSHYGYRANEVRQMLAMLDEAIADLRAATATPGRFDLSFAAFVDPPTVPEPLLPPPTPQEAIEHVLTAARIVDNPSERTSLLSAALVSIDRDKDALPATWAAARRADIEAAVRDEVRLDGSYKLLTTRIISIAEYRAANADVLGLERLIRTVHIRDQALGEKRPEAVNALLAVVEEKLDAARRLQLARDRWQMRQPVLREYRVAIRQPIDLFTQLNTPLEAIKALSGSTAESLATIERLSARIVTLASAIVPPEELTAAHALLMSAVQLAKSAASIRREATLAGDMTRAWDASSAAAGALMLGAKARTDIQSLLRLPQLPQLR
jgi:hypothetical protein